MKRHRGFTLVEIMIVVLVIGILAAIAIPNMLGARTRSWRTACIDNLRGISSAKEQWALANGKGSTDTPTNADLSSYEKSTPICPAGGTYAIGDMSTSPTCTIPTHVWP